MYFCRIARTCLVVAVTAAVATGPAAACTGIMLKTNDGSFVHGRTVEFGATIDER